MKNSLLDSIEFWADIFTKYFTGIFLVFKILIFIFFAYNFIKKSSNICNNYFYFVFIGFFWDIIYDSNYIVSIIGENFKIIGRKSTIFNAISDALGWYIIPFTGIWTLLLTIMRYTAIVWWQKYDVFWTKYFYKTAFLLHIFPFLIQGYSFFNYKCRLGIEKSSKKCEKFWEEDTIVYGISNLAISTFSLIIAIYTVVIYQIRIKKDVSLKQNPDRKLLFQALFSSILFSFHSCIYLYLNYYDTEGLMYLILDFIEIWSYSLYPISTYFLLFVFSPALRKSLFDFYRVSSIYKGQSKTKVKQLTNDTTITASVSKASRI